MQDLALLRVQKRSGQAAALLPLDEVRGDEIGSIEIDLDFLNLVERRLATVAQQLGMSHEAMIRLATRMVREKFRAVKEEFGKLDIDERALDVKIEMPGVSDSFTLREDNIFGGKMYFQRYGSQTRAVWSAARLSV